MTKDEWYMLAEKLQSEAESNLHTQQTNDILGALHAVSLRMWANTPEPKQ